MIIDFKIYKDLDIIDNLNDTLSQIDEQVLSVLVLASEELAKYIITQKLSGQVLNRRTGKLQESVSAYEASRESFQYTMIVAQDEEIAPYGPIHEFGGHVPERVAQSGSALHWLDPDGKDVFAMRARAFDMPIRSYMRSALEENDAHIQEMVREAVQRTILTNWGT